MNSKIYNVTFKNRDKNNYFISDEDLEINTHVIVQTEKGEEYGKIVLIKENDGNNYNSIIRIATSEDNDIYYDNLRLADEALKKCREFVNSLGLEMHVINAEFTFDKSQLLINFTADERVDFRELARKMAGIYRTRIELHQVGARDKAKQVCGIGICGQKLCCASFLTQLDSISMNKAKNQNLALNPSKINGVCGRLLCCLCYEDDEYTRCNKGLYQVGETIKINGKDGKIISVDILSRTYKILVDDEKITIKHEELNASKK